MRDLGWDGVAVGRDIGELEMYEAFQDVRVRDLVARPYH